MMTIFSRAGRLPVWWMVAICALAGLARGAVLSVEEFTLDDAGWTGGSAGTVVHNPGGGNTGGAIEMTLDPDGMPLDAYFTADVSASDGAFAGDYLTAGAGTIYFDFYAVNVAPSALFLLLSDDVNTFMYGLVIPASGDWTTCGVQLSYTAGWDGMGAAAFATALQNVTSISFGIFTSGDDPQTYRLDNIELSADSFALPSSSAIPEPSTITLLSGVLILALSRRFFQGG